MQREIKTCPRCDQETLHDFILLEHGPHYAEWKCSICDTHNGFVKKPKKMFIVHGEEKSSKAIREKLDKEGFSCHIPYIGEKVDF